MSTVAADRPATAQPRLPRAPAVAALLVRFRVRHLWNGVRSRGRGRLPTLVVFVGLLTSLAYVGLFLQVFATIVRAVDFDGQVGALALVTAIVAFGSWAAKSASSDAVLSGAPENEFLMARPVSLATLVVSRCLADTVTDPFGALFLLPVLLAAAITWRLPGGAVLVAALSAMIAQLGISAISQATQIGIVRFVPRARRRAAWMSLRLLASLSLAVMWMLGTWALRTPDLGRVLEPLARAAALSPGALVAGPLAASVHGSGTDVALRFALLVAGVLSALALAAAVARRAAQRGWEEAGPSWAEAAAQPQPGVGARPGRLRLTAATKDLLLIARDRTQLLALITMPVIFVGVQLFGSAGWGWSTASLQRVSYLAFSLTLYMATIGPLTHMQAERRAFWILRAVPVPVGKLLAAKARAWSVVVGGTSAVVYAIFSLGAPVADAGAWLTAGLFVVAGAVGMTWLAIALASRAADLSDDQRPAIGPATIYTFLLVGGLYNLVLAGDGARRLQGIALYLFALATYWMDGVERAGACLDPEEVRAREVRVADGATMMVLFALGQPGATEAVRVVAGTHFAAGAAIIAQQLIVLAVGLAAFGYLARRSRGRARLGLVASGGLAVAAGAGLGFLFADHGGASPPAAVLIFGAAILLSEELVFRGVVQRGLESSLARRGLRAAPALAAAASAAVSVVAIGEPTGVLVAGHVAAAAMQAATGRTAAAWLVRVIAMLVATRL